MSIDAESLKRPILMQGHEARSGQTRANIRAWQNLVDHVLVSRNSISACQVEEKRGVGPVGQCKPNSMNRLKVLVNSRSGQQRVILTFSY